MEKVIDITEQQSTKTVAELQQEAFEVAERNKQQCGAELDELLKKYGLRLEVETIINSRGITPRIYFEIAG